MGQVQQAAAAAVPSTKTQKGTIRRQGDSHHHPLLPLLLLFMPLGAGFTFFNTLQSHPAVV
jgi:hypothetical protein